MLSSQHTLIFFKLQSKTEKRILFFCFMTLNVFHTPFDFIWFLIAQDLSGCNLFRSHCLWRFDGDLYYFGFFTWKHIVRVPKTDETNDQPVCVFTMIEVISPSSGESLAVHRSLVRTAKSLISLYRYTFWSEPSLDSQYKHSFLWLTHFYSVTKFHSVNFGKLKG